MPPSDALTLEPIAKPEAPPLAERVTCLRLQDGAVLPRDAAIAAEVPIALTYNGRPHVVMMATPADLADFALGFSLSEGILSHPNEVLGLDIEAGATGMRVAMTIAPERYAGLRKRRRNLTGRTGCAWARA